MFPAAFLDEIRARAPLGAVVGRRVPLAKKGREFLGLCPFHTEKTGSFTVNEEKGFFHCFGCGAHGDVIEFVARSENLSFPEAVAALAAEAGLELPAPDPEERANAVRRASLLQACEAAAAYYHDQLMRGSGAARARDYLTGRGLDAETVERFRLGWAPAAGLRRALDRGAYPDELLLEAGLLRQTERGLVELLRERVVFPIGDGRGRVVAFGGRTLGDGQPKYLNSPETPLFHKGAALFGLAQAREAAGRAGRLVVLEGYMDVLTCSQAGLAEVVAPLGTAVTESQLDLAWRAAPEVVLCLDGDGAGQRAMDRTLSRALPLLVADKRLRFAWLPGGRDPDEVVRADGLAAMTAAVDGAETVERAAWRLCEGRHDRAQAEGQAAFERGLYALNSMIADEALRRTLLNRWRRRLADENGPPLPTILRGRSKKNAAPEPGGAWVGQLWQRAQAQNAVVRDWLERQQVDWGGLSREIGGVGFLRARLVKGRYGPDAYVTPMPAPPLWEPEEGGVGLVILPAWDGGDVPCDLVGWRPPDSDLACLTGAAALLGQDLVEETRGFEARGLARDVPVADSPIEWLRRMSRGRRSALVVDWARVFEALSGLSGLAVEDRDFGLRLKDALTPPVSPPRIFLGGGD